MNEEFEYDKFNKDPDYEPTYCNLNENTTKDYDINQYYKTPYEYYENNETNISQANSFMNNSKTSSNYFHYYNNNKADYNYPKPYEISLPITRRSLKHLNSEIHPIKNKVNIKYQNSLPLITNCYDKENYDLISSQYEIKNLVQVYDASKEEKNIFNKKNRNVVKNSSPPKYFRKNIVYSIFEENGFRKNSIKKLNTDLFNVNKSKSNIENSDKKKNGNNFLKSNKEKKREISNKKELNTTTTNNTTTHIYIDLGDRTTIKNNKNPKNKIFKKKSETFEIESDNYIRGNGTNSCNKLNEKPNKKIQTQISKNNSINKTSETPKFKQILINGKNHNKTNDSITLNDSNKKNNEKKKTIIRIKKNNKNQKLEETSESSELESGEESEEENITIQKQENKKIEKNIITQKKYQKKNKRKIHNEKEKKIEKKEKIKDEHVNNENKNKEIKEKSIIKNEENEKTNINEKKNNELTEAKKKNLAIKTVEEIEIKEIDFEKIKDKIQNFDNQTHSLNSDVPLLSLTHKKISSFTNKIQHSNTLSNEKTRNSKLKSHINRSILLTNSEKKIEYPFLFRDVSEKSIEGSKYNTESVLKDHNIYKSISNPNCVSTIENIKNNENKESVNKINIKKNINIVSFRDNHNLVTIKSTRSKQTSNNSSITVMNSNSKTLGNNNNATNENIKTESISSRENNYIVNNNYGNCKGRGVSTNTDINKKRVISVRTENNESSSKNKLKNHCVKVTYGSSMNKNNSTFIKDSDIKKSIPTPAKNNHSLYVSGYSKKLNK